MNTVQTKQEARAGSPITGSGQQGDQILQGEGVRALKLEASVEADGRSVPRRVYAT